MPEKKLTILCVSDNSYLPFVKTLFNSIVCNVKIPYKLHLHTINVSEKEIDVFRNTYSNIEFTREYVDIDSSPFKGNAFNKSKKEAYCANIRVKILYDIMCSGTKYILYLDADSIVRKNLDDLLNIIKSSDLVIFRRDESTNKNVKVATGVIGINNNEKSFSFIKSWKDFIIQDNIMYSWYSDQKYFYKTMINHSDVYVNALPFSYIDTTFLDESIIWVGKAERKFENNSYLKEMGRYI